MKNEELLHKKWQKFLKLRSLFSFIPFLDFVIVAGSLVFGNIHEDSDFDVIVGARQGRIFTVRGFCIALFWPLGLLNRRADIKKFKKFGKDKICFNHFITPRAYRFSPPYNDYWKALYQRIVPVYGRVEAVESFFRANNWAGPREVFQKKEFWRSVGLNPVRKFVEFIFGGSLGNWMEKIAKKLQLNRIGPEKSKARGETFYKPRLRFDDEELEFHPDTRRIEEMIRTRFKK